MNYKSEQWKKFRKQMIEIDGNKCQVCGRSGEEVILQVHHKRYIPGKKPWEYAFKDCLVLCKGCHAAEHGIIPPRDGWKYIGHEDLGGLVGTCQICGTMFRYAFYIFHEVWGTLEVGEYCCDSLTSSKVAETQTSYLRNRNNRKKRLINSKRWQKKGDSLEIKQSGFTIEILKVSNGYRIHVNKLRGRKVYDSVLSAKERVFDLLEDGDLQAYFSRLPRSSSRQ